MREVRKGKIQGKLFCGVIFPQALKEKKTLKRKKKKGERKEWKVTVLPDLENKTKMTPFKMNIYHFVSF